MSDAFDLERLAELQELLGTELPAIVGTLLGQLDAAMSDLETGLATGDLNQVAHAAHSARNSALMIDAQPLLDALRHVETGARAHELAATRSAHGEIEATWAPLRAGLVSVAGER